MDTISKSSDKLRVEYENERPVMKMEVGGVALTIHFAEDSPEHNTKKVIVDILTAQYIRKVSE